MAILYDDDGTYKHSRVHIFYVSWSKECKVNSKLGTWPFFLLLFSYYIDFYVEEEIVHVLLLHTYIYSINHLKISSTLWFIMYNCFIVICVYKHLIYAHTWIDIILIRWQQADKTLQVNIHFFLAGKHEVNELLQFEFTAVLAHLTLFSIASFFLHECMI